MAQFIVTDAIRLCFLSSHCVFHLSFLPHPCYLYQVYSLAGIWVMAQADGVWWPATHEPTTTCLLCGIQCSLIAENADTKVPLLAADRSIPVGYLANNEMLSVHMILGNTLPEHGQGYWVCFNTGDKTCSSAWEYLYIKSIVCIFRALIDCSEQKIEVFRIICQL